MSPEPSAVERQLAAILSSEEFAASPKMRALLRYLVEATLAGDAERLKGYAIGIDVFERAADFDPAADPIVRVQAGRLRKLLDSYYRTAGTADPIRIEIPKGGYAVEFMAGPGESAPGPAVAPEPEPQQDQPSPSLDEAPPGRSPSARWRQAAASPYVQLGALFGLVLLLALGARLFQPDGEAPAPQPPAAPASAPQAGAITLAVLPFTNMSRDETHARFADGLADALMTALAHVKSISLASRTSSFQYREPTDLRRVGQELGVRYLIEGSLQHDGERIRVIVQLIDAPTGAHLWAREYDRSADDELAVQRELVTTLAAELRPQLYSAAKRAIEAEPGEPATAWQLYMQSNWMPGEARNSLAWEQERIALATQALARDPNLGQADAVLADKLSYLANVDPPSDTPEAHAKASRHARRALETASTDADVMFNISIHHWHEGRMSEALDATRRTLELDPHHVLARFLVKAVPFTCSEAPRAVIDELAGFDAAISPDSPVRWLTLYWLGRLHLNNNDLARARDLGRRADQVFRTPDSFLQLAAVLVQLGDKETAVAEIDRQRENWPNLDPRHYAEVTVPRRCAAAPKAAFLRRVYGELADAVEAAAGK